MDSEKYFVAETHSECETEKLGCSFASKLEAGDVIALCGDLGAGKTRFVCGLARGLGFTGETSSPTFAIINEYIGGRLPLYHFDMYRISGWDDLETTGYFEYLEAGGVLAVEWSENIAAALPEKYIKVTVEKTGENDRRITAEVSVNEDFVG